jgi:hypothetical protein
VRQYAGSIFGAETHVGNCERHVGARVHRTRIRLNLVQPDAVAAGHDMKLIVVALLFAHRYAGGRAGAYSLSRLRTCSMPALPSLNVAVVRC